jgi:hypothetical protein
MNTITLDGAALSVQWSGRFAVWQDNPRIVTRDACREVAAALAAIGWQAPGVADALAACDVARGCVSCRTVDVCPTHGDNYRHAVELLHVAGVGR